LPRKLSVSAKSDTFPICMQFQKQKTYQQSCSKVGETYTLKISSIFSCPHEAASNAWFVW
jgi:hypothetical protein